MRVILHSCPLADLPSATEKKIASRPPDASVVRNVPRTVREDVLCGRGPEWVRGRNRYRDNPLRGGALLIGCDYGERQKRRGHRWRLRAGPSVTSSCPTAKARKPFAGIAGWGPKPMLHRSDDVSLGSMNETASAVACGNDSTTSVEARGRRS